jgi:hypothetical protein
LTRTSLQFAAALGRTQMMNTEGRSQAGESKPSGGPYDTLPVKPATTVDQPMQSLPMTADISPALTGL